jgi:membrane protease YdiL (CAAX protease family)
MRQFLKPENFSRGAIFAAIFLALSFPYIIYYFFVGYSDQVDKLTHGSPKAFFFISQAIAMYVALLISGTAGFAWSDGKNVAGLGSTRTTIRNLKWLIPLGIVISVLAHYLFDNELTRQDILYNPKNPLVALVIPLKSAFFEEGIIRFGILTIMYRLTRNKWAAITISSLFGIAASLPYVRFLELEVVYDFTLFAMIATKFIMGLLIGLIYCRWGLKSTMALRFIIDLRYVLLAF